MPGPVFEITKWSLAVLTVAYAGSTTYPFLRRNIWVVKLIALMALCYPLGKAIEFWFIGPEFVRAHLSDFGFVPCIALVLYDLGWMRRFEPWRRWLIGATAVLVVAAGVEAFELAFQRLEVAKNTPTRGDWGDMASYFISYFLLLVLARIQVRKLRAATAAHSEAVEVLHQIQAQERRESQPQKKSQPGSRRGPHGRRRGARRR